MTLGNIVGGALFTGAFLWYLYGRDTTLAAETGQPLSGEKKTDGGGSTHGFGHGCAADGQSDETGTAGSQRDGLPQRRSSGDLL